MVRKSELILNPDGSIYHLGLVPSDIGHTIILVGDPARVGKVSKYFDSIEVKKTKREFVTHTGIMGGKRLSVISSGISTDNIDIVINELDALVNIDLTTGQARAEQTSLTFIRLGTSGSIRAELAVDSIVTSRFAIGLDGLDLFYAHTGNDYLSSFSSHIKEVISPLNVPVYISEASQDLISAFDTFSQGVTLTCTGFYGPQGRELRVRSTMRQVIESLSSLEIETIPVTNIEMETSAIYFLSKLLGHEALSINAILANRKTGEFSNQPSETIDQMITSSLDILRSL